MNMWENQRLKCIGASEVGALFNCNPYLNVLDLFKLKTGLAKSKPINAELNIVGHYFESIIIDYVEKHFNLGFTHNKENKHYTYAEYGFIGCTPDAMNDEAILQCKTYRLMNNRKKWSESHIPFNYILQTLQEMFVLEKTLGYLGVQYLKFDFNSKNYIADEIEVYKFELEAWTDTIQEIIKRSILFWKYVELQEIPDTNLFKEIYNEKV